MTAADIKTLPVTEKLQIMEAIWEDFRKRFENAEISPQVKALLDQRRARAASQETVLLDWDSVKFKIGKA